MPSESTIEFYKYIKSYIEHIARRKKNDMYTKAILQEGKNQLAQFDGTTWGKHYIDLMLMPLFITIDEYDEDSLPIVIIFIIYSKRLQTISSYNLNYIEEIARAFNKRRVLPSSFDHYLNILLNAEVYQKLASWPKVEQRTVIENILKKIPEDTQEWDLTSVLKSSTIGKNSFFTSPKETVDLNHIHNTFATYMDDPENADDFTENDFYALAILGDLDAMLSPEDKEALIKKILDIDTSFTGQRNTLVKISLLQALNYYSEKIIHSSQVPEDTIKFKG